MPNSNLASPWSGFHGPNLGVLLEWYEQYRNNPETVDPRLGALFEQWGEPSAEAVVQSAVQAEKTAVQPAIQAGKAISAKAFIDNIRMYGHLAANIDPIGEKTSPVQASPLLELEHYGLNEADLRGIPAGVLWEEAPEQLYTGLDVVRYLRSRYTQTAAYEFSQVHAVEEWKWLTRRVETEETARQLATDEKLKLLYRLAEAEAFEKYLHRTFVGQKRFSIEGLDMLVPMLDSLVTFGMHNGVHNMMIGMAHRGRLNVLAHVLGKHYETIFSEFHHSPNKELVPSEGSMGINFGWTGDVKYHLGADRAIDDQAHLLHARLTLANNPSHLEYVGPVVLGYNRAAQEERTQPGAPRQDVDKSFAILIHGDAAFPGEGIVAETLNLCCLPGFHTGGTIHIIANNQIGFTTVRSDSRSSKYASDLAKGYEIPIVHVNADDPEACLKVIHMAFDYRRTFHKDFLIDLIGYRRYGHNETDDPSVTQPQLYAKVNEHPTVKTIYSGLLRNEGVITAQQADEMEQKVENRLKTAYERMRAGEREPAEDLRTSPIPDKPASRTSDVPLSVLKEMNKELFRRPEGFTIQPKLERILKRRADDLDKNGNVDWALAESLSFAAILRDGVPIRFTGQDTERGTFAHRHMVLHDIHTEEVYCPLQHMREARASFAVHNSPLSEAGVLGFEYGYSVYAPETLVLWEAQFGDFANAAQVIFDQFVSSGQAKWKQYSGLVVLLPHGYEGQGPEHSSARLERFLQSGAERNWIVANPTTAAQYYHLLRRQAMLSGTTGAKPLIVMTPKSLLRHPLSVSPVRELSAGTFYPVLEHSFKASPVQVRRLVLCSGKIAVELKAELASGKAAPEWLHIAQVEQLYPFPEQEIGRLVSRFEHLRELVWLQEEPRNMGAWGYVEPKIRAIAPDLKLRYIGRTEHASPAEGRSDDHKEKQLELLQQAIEAFHESDLSLSAQIKEDLT